jgi:hypothetical protein
MDITGVSKLIACNVSQRGHSLLNLWQSHMHVATLICHHTSWAGAINRGTY